MVEARLLRRRVDGHVRRRELDSVLSGVTVGKLAQLTPAVPRHARQATYQQFRGTTACPVGLWNETAPAARSGVRPAALTPHVVYWAI